MSNVRTIEAPLQEIRAASTASGGTALQAAAITTTNLGAIISLPIGADWISVTPRNFAGGVVAKFAINPWLTIVKTDNLLLSEGTDISSEAQDGDTTAIAFGAFDTLANGDALYIGSWIPFRGVQVDVGTVNAVATTLTVEYWNGGSWVTTSATDSTDTGATFAVDANVTWTVPTAWTKSTLKNNGAVTATSTSGWVSQSPYTANLYWTRWTTSAAHTDPSTILQFRALNRSTAYAELVSGQTFAESFPAPVGAGNSFASVEAICDAGTANLIVNAATRYSSEIGGF